MIPDEVLKQVKNLNPLVEFHEFDTGHGIRSEAPKDFQKLIDRMLADLHLLQKPRNSKV